MIDALYNYRQGEIHSAEFSDKFNALCIPFEESLTEGRSYALFASSLHRIASTYARQPLF